MRQQITEIYWYFLLNLEESSLSSALVEAFAAAGTPGGAPPYRRVPVFVFFLPSPYIVLFQMAVAVVVVDTRSLSKPLPAPPVVAICPARVAGQTRSQIPIIFQTNRSIGDDVASPKWAPCFPLSVLWILPVFAEGDDGNTLGLVSCQPCL